MNQEKSKLSELSSRRLPAWRRVPPVSCASWAKWKGMEVKGQDRFNCFVGKLVRCVFRDGSEIQTKKGRLLSADDEFIELQTFHHRYLIRVSEILKLSDVGDRRA